MCVTRPQWVNSRACHYMEYYTFYISLNSVVDQCWMATNDSLMISITPVRIKVLWCIIAPLGGRHGVRNHRKFHRLFTCTSKLHVTAVMWGETTGNMWIPLPNNNNDTDNFSLSWRHHDTHIHIHRYTFMPICILNTPHKWPVTRKLFPFDDVIMRLWHLYFRSTVKLPVSSLWHCFK